jgi:hypothetical protein
MGGVDARGADDPDAPVLVVEGMAVFGGIDVGPKASAPAGDSEAIGRMSAGLGS